MKDIRVPGARVAGLPATTSFLDDSCQENLWSWQRAADRGGGGRKLLRVHQKESRWRWRLSLKDNTTGRRLEGSSVARGNAVDEQRKLRDA